MSRRIENIIAAVILVTELVIFGIALVDTAAQRDKAVAEAADLRAQLAEAQEQRTLIIEQAAPADMRAVNEAYTPAVEPPKQTVTVSGQQMERVTADELLGKTSLGSFTVTHYCPCAKCCGKSDGVTASGRAAEPYKTIAVDPKVIPLGTVCYLDYGDGVLHECRADDTGGAVRGNVLDLCVGDHATAVQMGRRSATVYVGGRE